MIDLFKNLISQLLDNPVGLLFVIISLGTLLGQIPLGKFKLGGAGVLIVGIAFGHNGFTLPEVIQTIGVVLFVYSVGLKAGPNIIESLKKSKGQFIIIALLITSMAGGLSIILQKYFNLSSDLITGIFAGSMTSTPALATSIETIGNSHPSIGFGVAYPIGIIGVIILVQVLPFIFRINIKKEEEAYRESFKQIQVSKQSFQVTNPNATLVTIGEILSQNENSFNIVRIKRGEEIITPLNDKSLKLNDVLLIVSTPEGLSKLKVLFGKPQDEIIPESENAKSQWLDVSSKDFIGEKLGTLEIASLYGVIITRIRRNDLEFVPTSNFVFEPGDEIRVSGKPSDLHRFAEIITKDPETVHQTDIFSFAFGLALGVLLAIVKIPMTESINIQLGIAGGPLLAGLVLGYFGRFGRITGYMPQAAKYLMGELGLYLFLAVAGCLAGEKFIETLHNEGPTLLICAGIITLVPIILTAFIARFVLKMNALIIMGMICGGMTSTPALGVISSNTKSDIPALAYTGIYPLAVVLMTIMAQFLAMNPF